MFALCLGENAGQLTPPLSASLNQFNRYTLDVRSDESVLAVHAALSRGPNCITRGPQGELVLFDGVLDNARELAHELGLSSEDPASLYAHAFARWGGATEDHLIGHYAAAIVPQQGRARLVRSAISAPPINFAWIGDRLIVASTAQQLIAAGLPPDYSPDQLHRQLFFSTTGEFGWLANSHRVDVGETVWIDRESRSHTRTKHWQPERMQVRRWSRQEAVRETERLLQEAIAVSMGGATKPGMLLSGGLDSSNVAARIVDTLPAGKTLPSFTFVPLPGWDGSVPPNSYPSEQPHVTELAKKYPAIEANFIAGEDRPFDHDWQKVFAAIGCAPPGLPNIAMYHSLFTAAEIQGCDMLLTAEHGNQTISIAGEWAAAEFLRAGKLGTSWQAATKAGGLSPTNLRKWLRQALVSHFPDSLWCAWQRIKGAPSHSANERIVPLSANARQLRELTDHAMQSGTYFLRNFPATREQWITDNFARGDLGSGEIELAFEQIYGIQQRDVCSYRPLVEHCLSLPTEMFMHLGIDRWLGRELGRDLLPEQQRMERRMGMHQADWHARLSAHIPQVRAEIDRAAERDELRAIFDFDELRARLDDWPSEPRHDDDAIYRYVMGVPLALMTIRYVRQLKGWNQP